MKFGDEPAPGAPLPILPGHVSPGRFERVLRAGAFAVTAELAPPDSADPEEVYARARIFDGYVDAINATDGSGANCHMSSMGVCALLTRVGYAPIMQISCRDRNRIGIQGDILGASAMGVCNVLCLTGDGVQAGDHPQAKPVFDLDSVSLLGLARTLRDEQRFQSGRKLTTAPQVFFGSDELTNLGSDDVSLRLVAARRPNRAMSILHECYAPGADTGEEMLTHKGEEGGVEAINLRLVLVASIGGHRCSVFAAEVASGARLRGGVEGEAVWSTREALLTDGTYRADFPAIVAAYDASKKAK